MTSKGTEAFGARYSLNRFVSCPGGASPCDRMASKQEVSALRLTPSEFFALEGYAHAELFADIEYVWEALARLDVYAPKHATARVDGRVSEGAWLSGSVFVASGAVVEPGAMVQGPTILGPGTVVRHGAYVRGYCVTGANCVIGHASEVKRAILLDGAQAPHFNYVGDSILGNDVNLGAGTKISNLKNDGSSVEVDGPKGRVQTGLRKFGAVVGDRVQTGCNSVASPGTLIGPDTLVYANAVLRGCYPARSIVKLRQRTDVVERRA